MLKRMKRICISNLPGSHHDVTSPKFFNESVDIDVMGDDPIDIELNANFFFFHTIQICGKKMSDTIQLFLGLQCFDIGIDTPREISVMFIAILEVRVHDG